MLNDLVQAILVNQGVKVRFSTKIIVLLGALLLLLLSMAGIALYSLRSFDRSSERVAHTLAVKQEIFQTVTALTDAESGQRGFIITGETNFLQPYYLGITNYYAHLDKVRSLTRDNPKQQALIDEVVRLAAEQLLALKTSLSLREQTVNTAPLAQSLSNGRALMERIRLALDDMLFEEERLLPQREHARLQAERFATFCVTLLGVVSIAIMGWMALQIRSEFRRRTGAEQELAQKNAALQETVGTLESYSYSIVHDMRAPLRAMTSFAQLLHSEYGERLDDDGRFYIERITQSSYRLDRLIQDVLTYSRVERDELPLQDVPLGTLLTNVISEQPELAAQRANIHISDQCNITVHSSLTALSQIFSNLLRNAVKFMSPGVTPDINVHCVQNDGVVRIEVRDNGIGIKPEHQPRIFGVFQRLHRPNEYEGTGIGLAIVKRSAERLGGRVGVESQPGQGSCFWVELPRNTAEAR